jgi:hypothetical protein
MKLNNDDRICGKMRITVEKYLSTLGGKIVIGGREREV